ncbi:hypothetical protein PGT21_007718 [Puccinia graminis f. sp. tritici]|uniref:Uncharacterized protein n=2 Tax=Puccinia graminis f. sp. tritici TaxID=56615 RepID=E3L6T0_PUCGT|nr:uncharacterized protein PGTG_18470 [Puccinia graminis f. sp. tritici CRL 75-36-700-3]EFP92255.1 hypothetical protein PGTG_18470 [Puccinia graminis f. sp. tritici CRL 75-36-700-3]KAA1074492.1 hypothetical protein PGT21_007718 [Puccinia graminis f. sp. tritici]KAA1116080.1 hypothetical protein PGTUg99_034484 [Puccinia graminis f. sp. tritici]
MPSIYNSARPSNGTQAISKKRPSPTCDDRDAPMKKRSAPLAPSGNFVPISPKTRHQILEKEMQTLFELEYQEEVVEYMHEMDTQTRPVVETIDLQPELQWYMRPYLIDFLIEIHLQYRLRPETLYLAVNVIDRYVSKRVVFKKHYQLVGCAALWIAAKYEDAKERVPSVQELSTMCCGAYEESSFLQMEGHVLSTIGWQLGHPTAEAWLRLFSIGAHRQQAGDFEAASTGHLARFMMELTLFHRSYVGLKSADIAGGALLLARYILGKPRRASDESEGVLAVARLLDSHLGEHMSAISAVVMKKYAHGHFSRASTIVKEWYGQGHRFGGPETSASLPAHMHHVAQPTPVSKLSSSSSTTSISSAASSSRHSQLTPGSLSSLSLNSSPTSSISSYPSMECHSNASPSSNSADDDSRESSLMCSPQLACPKKSARSDIWPTCSSDMNQDNSVSSVQMSRNM